MHSFLVSFVLTWAKLQQTNERKKYEENSGEIGHSEHKFDIKCWMIGLMECLLCTTIINPINWRGKRGRHKKTTEILYYHLKCPKNCLWLPVSIRSIRCKRFLVFFFSFLELNWTHEHVHIAPVKLVVETKRIDENTPKECESFIMTENRLFNCEKNRFFFVASSSSVYFRITFN